jgi:hypothetical protein
MTNRPTDTLSTLESVLASAARIARDIADDPHLPRLLEVYRRMPAEDRETVLNILEREVDLRTLAKDAPALSGVQIARPNPNARLYFRVSDSEPPPFISPQEITQAVIRAAHVLRRATERDRGLASSWRDAMVTGLKMVPSDQRETLRSYHETMLELLARTEPE